MIRAGNLGAFCQALVTVFSNSREKTMKSVKRLNARNGEFSGRFYMKSLL
jgi:hypothetical protein